MCDLPEARVGDVLCGLHFASSSAFARVRVWHAEPHDSPASELTFVDVTNQLGL